MASGIPTHINGKRLLSGRSDRELAQSQIAHQMAQEWGKRGEYIPGLENFDRSEVRTFERKLKHLRNKQRAKFISAAEKLTDAELAQALPSTLDKFLYMLSIPFLQNKYVGVMSIMFRDRRHLREFHALATATHGTLGQYEDIDKLTHILPTFLVMEMSVKDDAEIIKRLFTKIEITEELCKEKMPVAVKIIGDNDAEMNSGRENLSVIFFRPHYRPIIDEIREDVTPHFLIDEIRKRDGNRGIRKYFAARALIEVGARYGERIDGDQGVMKEIEDYVENNVHGVLTIETKMTKSHMVLPPFPKNPETDNKTSRRRIVELVISKETEPSTTEETKPSTTEEEAEPSIEKDTLPKD